MRITTDQEFFKSSITKIKGKLSKEGMIRLVSELKAKRDFLDENQIRITAPFVIHLIESIALAKYLLDRRSSEEDKAEYLHTLSNLKYGALESFQASTIKEALDEQGGVE